jgi:hypothetical protein
MTDLAHESNVLRSARLRRARRLLRPKVWRSVLLGATDPMNDEHWAFISKRGTDLYLEDPEPWLAPGASTDIAANIDGPDLAAFEWGAGSSTLWFVSQGVRVVSYETHSGWADEVDRRARGHADVRLVDHSDPAYSTPDLYGFRFVLIDGRQRNACGLHVAATFGAGVVIFDDSHRERYQPAIDALSRRSVWQRHFPGLSAMMTPKLTSVFRL